MVLAMTSTAQVRVVCVSGDSLPKAGGCLLTFPTFLMNAGIAADGLQAPQDAARANRGDSDAGAAPGEHGIPVCCNPAAVWYAPI